MKYQKIIIAFFRSLFGLLIVFSFTTCHFDDGQRPNIVIIFMDDMGYADIGCYGATDYSTPNIDRLAKEGMRFTNFYASQAVCSASRGSLLTGCYSERISIYGALHAFSMVGIHPNEVLIPEMLKEQSYATGIFGKWHLGHHQEFMPLQHGFDEFVGLPYSNDMWGVGCDGLAAQDSNDSKSNYPPLLLFEGNTAIDTIANLEDQAQLTSIYTERAVAFIHEHKEEPFFLYLPHSMVHVPIAVSDRFKGKSGKGLFADVMMEVDWSVGEVLNALEENDLSDHTLVIFSSDNGPWLNYGNHAGSAGPLREGKGSMWEGGPKVSTLMRWPRKIPAGSINEHLASSIDVLPTLCEITGSKLPDHMIDGISMLPMMLGDELAKTREQFYYYYMGDLIAVRKNNWKLVFPHEYTSYENLAPGKNGCPGPVAVAVIEEMELYDLSNDIGEQQNVIEDHPGIVQELMVIGDSARSDLGDGIMKMKGRNNRYPGLIRQEQKYIENLAIGKSIVIKNDYASKYSGQGEQTLINGLCGSLNYSDNDWLGFEGVDIEVLIDLEDTMEVKEISCGFLLNQRAWIFIPDRLEVSVSEDGAVYSIVKSVNDDARIHIITQKVVRYKTEMEPRKIRYIKVKAKNIGECPSWHAGVGSEAWLFIDEISIK